MSTIEIVETEVTETHMNESSEPSKKSPLDRAIFILLTIAAFLLPLLFIPYTNISLEAEKTLFLAIVVSVASFLWLLQQVKLRSFTIPRSPLLIAGALVAIVFAISAIVSPTFDVSFSGFMYNLGTAASMFILFLLLFLTSVTFQSEKRILYFYGTLFLSFAILFAFQFARILFGIDTLSLGVFFGSTDTLLGKWNDFAVFAGLMALLSVSALEFASWNMRQKYFLYTVLGMSLLSLVVVNLYLAWILIGLFALMLLVYNLTFTRGIQRKKSTPSLIVLVLSVIFLIGGSFLGDKIAGFTNIAQFEARPSWESTITIINETWKTDVLLGAGPQRFSQQWLLHKDPAINQTLFWNTDFAAGIGLIPSFAVTTGTLGIVAWLLFLGTFLYRGVRVLFVRADGTRSHYFAFSSFIGALYLWLVAIFYVPRISMFALAFLMTGIFMAFSIQRGLIKTAKLTSSRDARLGFASTLIAIITLIALAGWGYVTVKKTLSLVYVHQATISINVTGDLEKAEEQIIKALRLNESDVLYRNLVEVERLRLRSLLTSEEATPEEVRAQFQALLGNAIDAAQGAIAVDETNYKNWQALFLIYSDIVQLDVVAGAYENALASLGRASEHNPFSPELVLDRARLEVVHGDNDAAREAIKVALTLKNNYTEAIFLLAQIEIDEGNVPAALESLEVATLINPNDTGLFFNLGLLKYNQADYSGAIAALERVVFLDRQYSNAKYFLGLSYYQVNRTAEAIVQFEGIQVLNPDNKEVTNILRNLKDGRAPFTDATAPASLLGEPPIEE